MYLDLVAKIEAEVDKLVKPNIIREVPYSIWLENLSPIKKKNGQIRVSIDFKELDKACPKDDFSMMTRYEALSFLDWYSDYKREKNS